MNKNLLADYEKALLEDKIILLNFYANWCPNGKEFSRSLDSWDKATFDTEVSQALTD